MLDYDGGPNHAGNLCDTPIVSNEVILTTAVRTAFHGRQSRGIYHCIIVWLPFL